MAVILNGSEVARQIISNACTKVDALKENGIIPALAIFRIGEDQNLIAYEKSAAKRCSSAGIEAKQVTLPENISLKEALTNIEQLNSDENVHGVLILSPLPQHIDDSKIRTILSPDKDIDGITAASLAGVFTSAGAGYAPCTAEACMRILDYYKIDCAGKRAVVLGRSMVVGKPAAMMLMSRNATVTVCHSKTEDIPSITRNADIIIAATGQSESLTAEYFSPGQTVIDVGTSWNDEKGKLCGDVCFSDAEPIVSAITPVPGGVGTVTSAVLISHVIDAAGKTGKTGD